MTEFQRLFLVQARTDFVVYPWPRDLPQTAPAERSFGLWSELQETAAGRRFLELTARLFDSAEAFL